MLVICVHNFVCGLRLMFSCNLRILFITQRNEGRSVARHVCVVLLYSGISEYHVAVAVAYSCHSVRCCIAFKYLTQTVPPLSTYVSITRAHIP